MAESELSDDPQFKDIRVVDKENGVSIQVGDRHIKLNYSDARFLADAILDVMPRDKP